MTNRVKTYWKPIATLVIGLSSFSCYAHGAKSESQDATVAEAISSRAAALDGQSQTLLPNGGVLLIGGMNSEVPLQTAGFKNTRTGELTPTQGTPLYPRAFHSATLLPNGSLLIFGGVGAENAVVPVGELFDPAKQSFSKVSLPGLTPRAYHTATLLLDGRVLIAGGVDSQGHALTQIDLWDYRTGLSTRLPVDLHSARIGHTAKLLPDGTVLLSGGHDENGVPLHDGEMIDPSGPSVRLVNGPVSPSSFLLAPNISATTPQSGETGIPTDQVVSLLFSKPMDVTTLNSTTVTLRTFSGSVNISVVPAEGGMLVFITPTSPLQNDKTYTLSISGATDSSGQPLPASTVVFTTMAAETAGVPTGTVGSSGSGAAGWQNGSVPIGTGGGPSTSWRKLPMLPASAGVTALSGQVLKLDGTPLPNVLVEIGSHHATTDNTGRFLVQDLGPGHHMMLVDGGPAKTSTDTYGIYRVGIDLKAGKTNSLSYVVWMTPLDTQHVVKIESPTTSDTVITNPNLPGLEVHIPAGTIIRDARGKIVTQVGITPILEQQPPFPLKRGVIFPLYFTIQPGGATFTNVRGPQSAGPNARPRGAQIYYENHFHSTPNTAFAFWNYDPMQKGWYVYGHGRVSGDSKMIVPDEGTQIWSFDGAMVSYPTNAYPNSPNGPDDGDPIDLGTGLFVYTKTDLTLNDVIPISLTRTYRQSDYISRAFGIGMNMNLDMFMVGDADNTPEGYTYQDLYFADGEKIHFTRTSPCTGTNGYCNYNDAVYEALSTPGPFYGATLQWITALLFPGGGFWTVTTKDGTSLRFPDSATSSSWEEAAIIGLTDRHGNTLTFTRDAGGNLLQITSPNGRWIKFTYDEVGASNLVTGAQDSSGRTTSYTYNSAGYLATATDANGGVTSFIYDSNGNMTSITDPRNIAYIQNQYDVNDMVYQQTEADGGVYQFSYSLDSNSNVTQANITDPRGYQRTVAFNSDGYSTSDTRAVGMPEVQAVTYSRQEGTGLLLGMTDALNRTTTFNYDAMADVIGVTQLASTANAVTTTLAYNPQYYELSSITDPLGNTTSGTYDSSGNLLSVTDPLGNTTSATYNQAGQPVTITDPLGNQSQATYSTGNLASITDPLGRTISAFIDSATRYSAIIDPLGKITRFNYDPLNQITSIIDPLGNTTSFTYDGNGNRLTVTDADNHTTSYIYDSMDRPTQRTDPLENSAHALYDLNGNMNVVTDRNGSTTTVAFDGINRPTSVCYGFVALPPACQSTVSYGLDAGNRLTGVTDSIGGSISRTYDGLDRLLSETTPQGSVGYTYDADERRQSMTVPSQSAISYAFDSDSRLTSITQGAASVAFGYDADSRRNSLVLPSGNTAAYNYDASSQLLGIIYQGGSLGVANLEYSYDLAGRRVAISGSLANEQLPTAVSSAMYNADNQLTQWSSTAMTYDLNGNTLNDGTNAYVWDARNRLVSANSNSATFGYDPLNRRLSRTIMSTTTNFLYDGANPVQEQNGSGVTANLLTGGIDERFQRTDSTGAYSYLTDALGSTMALTNSTGAVQTTYSYGAFGVLSATGSNSNDYTYTGREADGLGIDYFRARYYNPNIGRFINEDPLGLGAGPNLYSYTGGDPINFADPTGLKTLQVGIGGTGVFGTGWGGFSVTGGYGLAIDDQGGVAWYHYSGGGDSFNPGGPAGAGASGGAQWAYSNAQTVDDLKGPFGNWSEGGGDGFGGSADFFHGSSQDGPVTGAGFTAGFGAGFGAFAGGTYTTVHPIGGRKEQFFARAAAAYYGVAIPSLLPYALLLLCF